MKQVWIQKFNPTFIRADGIVVISDETIPLPVGFRPDSRLRSTSIFPSHTRAGDHYHQKRTEVFVGLGAGMQLLIENPDDNQVKKYWMDPSKNEGMWVAFGVEPGLPHAVINVSETEGVLLELANVALEKVDRRIEVDE